MNEGRYHAENLQRFRIRVQGREVRVHRLQGWPRRQKQTFDGEFTLNFRDNNIRAAAVLLYPRPSDRRNRGQYPSLSYR